MWIPLLPNSWHISPTFCEHSDEARIHTCMLYMPTLHDLLVMKDKKIQAVKIKLVRRMELSIFRKNKIIEQNHTRDCKKRDIHFQTNLFPKGGGALNVIFVTNMRSATNFGVLCFGFIFSPTLLISNFLVCTFLATLHYVILFFYKIWS